MQASGPVVTSLYSYVLMLLVGLCQDCQLLSGIRIGNRNAQMIDGKKEFLYKIWFDRDEK